MAKDTEYAVTCARAGALANGLIAETETGIKLTEKGHAYAEKLWSRIPDMDKMLLAGYIGGILKAKGNR
jgi:hypothetical protein